MSSIIQKMADFVINLHLEDIPQDAVREGKRFLLDSMGCALAAIHEPEMKAMQRYLAGLGGFPQATVIGSGMRTSVTHAALLNGLLIRALDYNDIYWVQDPCHPSDMIGAALACAEHANKTGSEALTAIIIAYELEMRWCHAATPGIREIGWHHASLTQFVSPFMAGKLYDLTADQLAAAAGISGSSHFTLGGVVAGHLTNMKNMADPMAAQEGVQAALMAREGVSGPSEIIEGKEGLVSVLNSVHWDVRELLQGLGQKFIITRCSYKAYPTEALTHQPITAAIQVCKNNGLQAEDIAKILVETTARGADILSDPSKYSPNTKETADHSLPYVVAAAIVDGNVLPDSFSQEKLHDSRIRSLLGKISVVADPEINALFPGIKRARVHVTDHSGKVYSAQVDDAKGSPQNPMSDGEIEAKFRSNSSRVITASQQDQIIAATMDFENCQDIRDFMHLLLFDSI